MNKKLFVVCSISAMILSPFSVAEEISYSNGLFITPELNYHFFDNDRLYKGQKIKDSFEGGLSVEKLFGNFGVGGYIGYGKADIKDINKSKSFLDTAIFGSYHFFKEGNLLPYLSIGLSNSKLSGKSLTGLYGDLGFKFMFAENLGFKAGVRDIYLWKGRNDYITYLGITYAIVGDKDSDGDGVFDRKDACSNTPKGVKVDSLGCPIDTDNDGIFDYMDECPDTLKGVKVDSVGCPLDTDNDGVPDYRDKCPNTPLNTKVDKNGCKIKKVIKKVIPTKPVKPVVKAVDSDKDGVPDDIDRCPNTPRGFKVDEVGCFKEVKLEVHFPFDSWEVPPKYYSNIGKFAKFLKEHPQIKVEIQGHTDSTGSEKYNLTLSQKRAEAVRNILIKNYNISPDRVVAKGYGESKPIASNKTKEGRAKNRRVVAVRIEWKFVTSWLIKSPNLKIEIQLLVSISNNLLDFSLFFFLLNLLF